ncbi:MAG: SUMF1/EgtB/PvdO family nonheme iron enzyme [Bacteroidota bacterium]
MILYYSMLKVILFYLFMLSSFYALAQENYTEKIPGTKVEFDMIFVEGSEFDMGLSSDHEWYEEQEGEPERVQISPFWMGKYEVTFDEFTHFQYKQQDSNISNAKTVKYDADAVTRPTPPYEDMAFGMGTVGGYPAVSMTQQAALRYCRWLYLKTGNFYRLPTEAEWEYACRAGKEDIETDEEELEERAWYYENAYEKFHKVGEKEANEWGFHDMLGNVAEWTVDQYKEDYHETLAEQAKNPWIKPKLKYSHTTRGGSYDDEAADCHCATRLKSRPRWQQRDPQIPKSIWWNTDAPFVGFRVVRPQREVSYEEVMAFFEEAIKD